MESSGQDTQKRQPLFESDIEVFLEDSFWAASTHIFARLQIRKLFELTSSLVPWICTKFFAKIISEFAIVGAIFWFGNPKMHPNFRTSF